MIFCDKSNHSMYLSRTETLLLLQGYIMSPSPVVCLEYCRLSLMSGHWSDAQQTSAETHTWPFGAAWPYSWWWCHELEHRDPLDRTGYKQHVLFLLHSHCSFSLSLPAQHSLVFSSTALASADIILQLSSPPIFLPACSPRPEHDTITCMHIMHALKKSVS